jgi:hypothetical protein
LKVALSLFASLLLVSTAFAEYTCELSFPHAPATALADFPVLVRISSTAPSGFSYADCPTASCIWFTDAENDVLPFESDTWNASGESLVWVSVPSLSSSTTITMHWSQNGGEDSPAASEVWTRAGYKAVWHFNGDATESATNLVSSLTVGAPTFNGNASYPGPLGKTLWLNGSSAIAYAVDPAWTTLGENSSLTISLLARPVTASLSAYSRMVCCQTAWTVASGYTFAVHSPNSKITLGSSGSSELAMASNEWSGWPDRDSDWTHFAAVYDKTSGKIFVNGVSKKTGSIKELYTPEQPLYLGANADGAQRYWTGGLDEIRIRAAASSAEWVAAENATATNSAYVSFGEVQEKADADGGLVFGALSVDSVSITNATFSSRLKGIGGGATSADVWLVVSGLGKSHVCPLESVGGASLLSASIDGLQPGTEWTAYFTATNDASPAVGAVSETVAFSTPFDAGSASPGLYQAVASSSAIAQNAAAGWDIEGSSLGTVTIGPLAMRTAKTSGTVHSWRSIDGLNTFSWESGTCYGYAGYMYMEGGKDYYFAGAIDDAGYVWVNNGAANWNASRSSSQLGAYCRWGAAGPFAIETSGYYPVTFSAWNKSGDAGAEFNASVLAHQAALRYAAVESGAGVPAMGSDVWLSAVDPGDGSLFRPTAPTRAVAVMSTERDGVLLSARVALSEAYAGEMSELRYVYGATYCGDNPADWDGGSLVAASLPATAVTNDYVVGIAADTRYVRFYTQSGSSVTWSATVSLDWADEGSVGGAFQFLGTPETTSIGAESAVFAASLAAPGAGASAAHAWFVLSGGGETRVIPAGTATAQTNLSVAVLNLTPATEYTFYCTATNNAVTPVGIDSSSAVFTTSSAASEWNTALAQFSQDGKTLTASIPVTSLGVGTTTLYLMTGFDKNNENTVSASQVVLAPGVKTLTASFPDVPWGKVVNYSLMLVNGTAENAVTNWPCTSGEAFYDKWFKLTDNSKYTWVGGNSGIWNVPANWTLATNAGSLAPTGYAGYPVCGSTAVFATAAGAGTVTVTIPAAQGSSYDGNEYCWIASTLDMGGMHEPLVFTSEDKTASGCRFRVLALTADKNYNRLVFDGCNFYTVNDLFQDKGAASADENGANFTVTFTGGSIGNGIGRLNVGKCPGARTIVEGGTALSTSSELWSGTTGKPESVFSVDNSTVTFGNKVEFDSYNQYFGSVMRLSGAGANVTALYFHTKYAASTNVVEFVIPSGGYSAVPILSTSTANMFPNVLAGASLTLRVAADSPGLKNIPRRGIQLVQSAAGINAANVKFEDVKPNKCGFFFKDADGNEYTDAAAIEAAGKTPDEIKEIWYRNLRGGFSIIVL